MMFKYLKFFALVVLQFLVWIIKVICWPFYLVFYYLLDEIVFPSPRIVKEALQNLKDQNFKERKKENENSN